MVAADASWVKFLREKPRITQFVLSRKTKISRARISLAELGEISLTPEEEARICRVLLNAIEQRVKELSDVLAEEQLWEANCVT